MTDYGNKHRQELINSDIYKKHLSYRVFSRISKIKSKFFTAKFENESVKIEVTK